MGISPEDTARIAGWATLVEMAEDGARTARRLPPRKRSCHSNPQEKKQNNTGYNNGKIYRKK
jgi:hypothetical protein